MPGLISVLFLAQREHGRELEENFGVQIRVQPASVDDDLVRRVRELKAVGRAAAQVSN